jgi:YVTN family beta-propeller protein
MRSALAFLTLVLAAANAEDHRPPGGDLPPRQSLTTHLSVLPGGRFADPILWTRTVGPAPSAMAVGPYEHFVVTADGGPRPFTLSILEEEKVQYRYRHVRVPRRPGRGDRAPGGQWQSGYTGLAFTGRASLYASEGNSGRIRLLQLSKCRQKALVDLNTQGFEDSYSAALAYDSKRKLLYAIDEANDRLAIVDARLNRVISSVATGLLPFALGLSPDRQRVYVTNAGVRGAAGADDPRSNSVCAIDVRDAANPRVVACTAAGTPTGGRVIGGSSPSAVLAFGDRVYVANAHNDSLTVLDAASLRRIHDIPIRVPGLESLRGVTPVSLAHHPLSGWLFVAEAGINAVGVIDTRNDKLIGHIPIGQAPTGIAIRGDVAWVLASEHLGPNAGRRWRYNDIYHDVRFGLVCQFGINYEKHPAQERLSVYQPDDPAANEDPQENVAYPVPLTPMEHSVREVTPRVYYLNGFFQAEEPEPPPAEIRHLVLIVRENRSFDELLGDVSDAANSSVRGDANYARFGMRGLASPRRSEFAQRDVAVTPNLHAIAARWALSDNFYSDAKFDTDGHYWLAGVYPDAWTLASLAPSYAGQKDARPQSRAPGRRLFFQGATDPVPEQYPEAGTLWHHLARHEIPFLRFDEGASDQERATHFIDAIRSRFEKPALPCPG